MKTGEKGFTLIEILVSLTLIGFSSIFLMKCMVLSLHQLRNSDIRFQVICAMDGRKSLLEGENFDSPELARGRRIIHADGVRLEITIADTAAGLKKISLRGQMAGFSATSVFTISKSLKGENNEQRFFNH